MPFSTEDLEDIYRNTIHELMPRSSPPAVSVSFYPYINVNNTIRIRNGQVNVRISDLLKDAPESVQRALAVVLVSKLLNARVPVAARDLEGSRAQSRGWIVPEIGFVGRQVRGDGVDEGLRFGDLGLLPHVEEVGEDERRQRCDDGQNHEDFNERKASR